MQTREELMSIKNRADPRSQMFYITEPYTSLTEDAMILAADSAHAASVTKAENAARDQSTIAIEQRFSAPKDVPERNTGHIVISTG